MSVCILVVDDEPDIEALFRHQFRRDPIALPRHEIDAGPGQAA
jgi:hypothetical protein